MENTNLRLVNVVRRGDLDDLVVHVFQSTNSAILATELSDSLDLDGLCILPMSTIERLDTEFDRAEFYAAAVSIWSPILRHATVADSLTGDFVRDLMLLSNKKRLVAVHLEVADPDICYVGIISMIDDESIEVLRISSYGKPIPEPLVIDFSEITKIEFETRYLTALQHAAKVLSQDDESASNSLGHRH